MKIGQRVKYKGTLGTITNVHNGYYVEFDKPVIIDGSSIDSDDFFKAKWFYDITTEGLQISNLEVINE